MGRYLKIGGIAVAALILIAVVFISFFLDKAIKMGIETVGPGITKTSITLESVKLSMFSGIAELKGLVVGNPEGFHTPEAISMGHIKLDLNIFSLFSDTIIIEEILVDGVEITYEASIKGSNIKTIMRNIESPAEKTTEEEQDNSKDDGAPESVGKKLQINNLVFKNGKIHISSKILKGKAVTIALPTIERKDIGKKPESGSGIIDKLKSLKGKKPEKMGSTVKETVASLFRIIFGAVTSAVAESGKLSGKDIRSAVTKKAAEIKEGTTKKLGSSIKEKGADAVDKLKGLFKK
ncbi:MAG: AsmA family protein [Candidatus Anammoxibacter sp.]